MSSDEFDNVPDQFDGIEGIDWTGLLSGPVNVHTNVGVPIARSPSASSTWSCIYDEMDSAFLAELDALEENHSAAEAGSPRVAAPAPNRPTRNLRGSTSTSIEGSGLSPQSNSGTMMNASHLFSNDLRRPTSPLSPRQPLQKCAGGSNVASSSKRAHSHSPLSKPRLLDKKRKWKIEENDAMKKVLSAFEDELTCPICCDLFVAAHLGNPCGHTVCGDCGWLWSKKNKDGGCAVCRTKMSKKMPMIPNIAIDNVVEKHVQALGSSGNEDWLPNGTKFTEWNFRKEKWKKDIAQRAKAKAAPPCRKAVGAFGLLDLVDIDLAQWIVPDDEDDDDYVNEDIEEPGPATERQPRQRGRRSRMAWRQVGQS